MATFILGCFAVFVLAFVAKLIYDVQQNKKSIKVQQNEITADEVDAFQKLAGIKPHDTQKGTNELVDAMLNAEKLKEEFKNVEFPAPDESITVTTAKVTTIDLNSKEDSDPLGSIPLSRVSKIAKQKMAEIAKQDISRQLEKNAEKFASIFPESVEYTDEYFKPDYSDYSNVKPKKKANPKQSAKGVDESVPFKKTRKTTKKKKENE